jgi:RNA-splicing ligase RtcB
VAVKVEVVVVVEEDKKMCDARAHADAYIPRKARDRKKRNIKPGRRGKRAHIMRSVGGITKESLCERGAERERERERERTVKRREGT